MHDHLNFIPQFVITQFEKLENITFSKTQKIKMALYTHRRVVYNIFQNLENIIYPYTQPLKFWAKFSEKNYTFSEEGYVRGTNFRWLYKPIGELFAIISKFEKYYLPLCMTSEIFSRFKRKKWSPPPPPPDRD